MSNSNQEGYDAFISYSHDDKAAARRIHDFLERYKLPRGVLPGRTRLRIYRDATDIRAGTLPSELESALAASRALVVCCSRAAVNSSWVAKEIDTFVKHHSDQPIVPVLLADDPESAIPKSLQANEHRYADLRDGWWVRWLRPSARDELVRALAAITRADLRALIPWEKRRKRRVAFYWGVSLLVVTLATLFVPFEDARKLARPQAIDSRRTIEYCDVASDRLVIGAREEIARPQGDTGTFVSYVAVYTDAFAPEAKWKWLDASDYVPRGRLLHASQHRGAQRVLEKLDLQPLRRRAGELAEELYGGGGASKGAVVGVWAAEPRTGLRLALIAVKPSPLDGADGPASGHSVVGIAEGSAPLRVVAVERLYPPPIDKKLASARGASLMQGLPILADGADIFIGMAVRADEGIGGLWRWDAVTSIWVPEKITGSVYSMVSDPRRPGRILVATAPAQWNSGSRKGRYAAQIFERADAKSAWREIQLLPVDSESAIQLCGFKQDGTLFVRMNQALFAVGSYNLYRRWFKQD